MHSLRPLGSSLLGLVVIALGASGCSDPPPARSAAPPIVAGLSTAGLDARLRGLVLLGELGCVACHECDGGLPPIGLRRGPDLAAVGTRLRAGYLEQFLADPCGVEPGTPMPDLLRDRSELERIDSAVALAGYLLSRSQPAGPRSSPDHPAAESGRALFHEIGCVACHAPRDESGGELTLPGSVPLGRLGEKYRLQGLRSFLLTPHEVRPAMRMPDFHLSPNEAHELGNYLLETGPEEPVGGANAIDPERTAAGRRLFAELSCAACHTVDDPARATAAPVRPLSELDPTRGCLSGTVGAWPFYALTAEQQADVRAALEPNAPPLSDEQRILVQLAARNCIACHDRGDFGGVTPARDPYFTGRDVAIGQDGRLPPTLTGVGAKLQSDWLVDTIAHGVVVRPYLRTRMPGFGDAFATGLASLLTANDHLPPLETTPLPEDRKQAEAVTGLGRELVGDRGMNCISCHVFAGDQVGAIGAVDLVESTGDRLRAEWFRHYLRAPVQFKPGTLMPQFFVDGVSVRPELGDGDAQHQIDAIWYYLAEGRNVRKPDGIRRAPIVLEVDAEAVMLRRSVQNTGKRGISVGYPSGVNLSFDAESLALNQIWWGGFIDAAGVWTGQGSGEARILGKDRVTLPKGPAFVVLPDTDAPWPDLSRRELDQQFLGYDLDAQQRPAFRYVCEDVTITDAPIELQAADASRPILRRKLSFLSASDKTLQFRVARDARIEDLGDGMVRVGPALHLRLPPDSFRVRAAGDQHELLVAIPLRVGTTDFVIDYEWKEEDK